jgi:hypothetical protein
MKAKVRKNICIFAETTSWFTVFLEITVMNVLASTLVLAAMAVISLGTVSADDGKGKSCCSDKSACSMTKASSSAKAQKAPSAKIQKVASISKK